MAKRSGGRAPARSPRGRQLKAGHERSGISSAIGKALAWHDAHVDFDDAVHGLAAALRGQRPAGMPHSPWEIVEHIRIAQHDILDFCRNRNYAEMKWPDEYWPPNPAPPSAAAWDASIAAFHRDLKALQDLAADPVVDLFAAIPHGSGQTYLRELILVIDHNAYHVGELVSIRRMLGAWR
jgi:uncharacterized damage-inducible protein DinB